ncbi:hypothetical protein IV203_014103 [Nitzschia inconspicua]|uniref:DUF6824 domain-containing protein n=1 Tax=Nitzschia inconspicua TaxID=303405 RepID=A0A9K3K5Z7_9STRA|nr:hypothetical protein IV203_014291 [Nitzschia inconspicua]KAG7375008.1 hypothetical protein IV203_014103 [Nitzschia inconspicua]
MAFSHCSLWNDSSLPTAVHTEHHFLSGGTEDTTEELSHQPYCNVQRKTPPSSLALQPDASKRPIGNNDDDESFHLLLEETYLELPSSPSLASSPSYFDEWPSTSPVIISSLTNDDTAYTALERDYPNTFGECLPTFVTPVQTLKETISLFNDKLSGDGFALPFDAMPQVECIPIGPSSQLPFLQSWPSPGTPSTADLDGPFDERNRLLLKPLLSRDETTVNNTSDQSPSEEPGQGCTTRNESCVSAKSFAGTTTDESRDHNPTRRCATVQENKSRKITGKMKAPSCNCRNTVSLQANRRQTGEVAIMKSKRKRGPRCDDPINKTYFPLTDLDVIFGRGGRSYTHPGNQSFRRLILAYQDYYQDLKDAKEKTDFSSDFVAMIHEQGGRFLKKDDHGWYEVTFEAARYKVSQAFRDDWSEGHRNERKKSSTQEKK